MTTDGQPAPPAPAPAGTRPPHRLRNVLLIVTAFLVVLGAVAGGAFVFFYDRATAIDRSTPEVVTDQFLEAALQSRDTARLSLFICDGWSADAAIDEAGDAPDPGVVVSWGDPSTTIIGNNATAIIHVRFTVHDGRGLQEEVQTWTLDLENRDGWRVCGLTKESSL